MLGKLSRALAIIVVVALTVTAAFSAQGQTTSGSAIRFVHALPGAGAIDVYVSGDLAISNLAFGQASGYLNVPSGQYPLVVTQHNSPDQLWQQTVNAPNGGAVTLVVSSVDPLQFNVFGEDLNPIAIGKARFTAIHAIKDGPTVDIILADGRPVVPGLQYGAPYGTLDLPAMTYNLAVVPTGASLSDAIIPASSYSLNSGTSYVAVAYGTASNPQLMLLQAPTRAESPDAGSLRFAHLVEDAPAVDVYLNDTLVAPSLQFSDSTTFMSVPAGLYTASVRLAGTQTLVTSGDVDVATGGAITAQVVGNTDTQNLMTSTENFAQLNPRTGLFKLVNAAADGVSVSASLADGTSLTGKLPSGQDESVALQPSDSGVVVSVDADGVATNDPLNLSTVYGGVFYNAVAINGASGAKVVLLDPVSVAQGIASAPTTGSQDSAVPTAAPVPTATATPVTVAQAEAPTPVPGVVIRPEATVAPPTEGPTARVLLNPGANLQLRQYPSSAAFSLGLAPSGSSLLVVGRAGAPVPPAGSTPDPNAEEFVDPAEDLADDEDLDPASTWLNVIYVTPDGGSISAWVNALYLSVSDTRGHLQRLADLPTVPSNRAGSAQNTSIQPPSSPDRTIFAYTGNVSGNARIHIRRTPDITAESLALVPGGTKLVFIGLNEDQDWYFVRYEDETGIVTGWTSAQYITSFERRGVTVSLERIDELGELVTLTGDERGGVTVRVAPTSSVPEDIRDLVVGTVFNLNPGANLHLRRSDNDSAESLALLPGGTIVTVDAQNVDGTWLRATYNGTVGWVFAQYIQLTLNGESYKLEDLPVVDTSPTPTPTETSQAG